MPGVSVPSYAMTCLRQQAPIQMQSITFSSSQLYLFFIQCKYTLISTLRQLYTPCLYKIPYLMYKIAKSQYSIQIALQYRFVFITLPTHHYKAESMANIISKRRLPVGIQSFREIRKQKYLYVDKTDIIWNLVNGVKYNYLSRPRRFGKSVLVDTLKAYFEGQRELFEGLKIMELETEWKQYPVIRLDMSQGGASADSVRSYFNMAFKAYEEEYGVVAEKDDSLAVRFNNIIMAAYRKTGLQVVILIDEYDAPLQHSWQTPEHDACTAIYREVFAILKSDDEFERFVFITGITKFTQISLFSVLNNLFNISFEPQFAAICGITEKEIGDNFKPELEEMSRVNGWTLEETHDKLKGYYDGYHFSEDNMVDIYNPFSLINALATSKLRNFWAQSGATSMLPKFVDNMELRLEQLNNCFIDRDTLETSMLNEVARNFSFIRLAI